MKKKSILIFILAALVPSILSFTLFAALKESNIKTFDGRIINITNEFIELKKGGTEIIVYLSEDTKFISKDGTEGTKNIIEICQYVKAYYVLEEMKKILSKIIITKESDCIK